MKKWKKNKRQRLNKYLKSRRYNIALRNYYNELEKIDLNDTISEEEFWKMVGIH